MNTADTIGFIFAIIAGIGAGICGLLWVLFNTMKSYRVAKGPQERRFLITSAACLLLVFGLFPALTLIAPQNYRWILWVLYVVLLWAGCNWANKQYAAIRTKESQSK